MGKRFFIQASVYSIIASLVLLSSVWQASAAQFPLALNYNFNGMVHPGEEGVPDAPAGFRSISDRALVIDGSAGAFHGMTSPNSQLAYTIVNSAGALDLVHVGNRNTVDGGSHAFDAVVNGDSIGIQPSWLPNPDQSSADNPVSPAILMTGSSKIGVLYNISNGGGNFDVTLSFSDGSSAVVTLNGPDWFGPFDGQPGAPGSGVLLQQNLPGTFKGSGNVDMADPDADLLVTEAVITAPLLLSNLGFDVNGKTLTNITFSNGSNPDAGYAVYAVTVDGVASAAPAVPAVNGWGMLIFMALAGLGAAYYLRRQRTDAS